MSSIQNAVSLMQQPMPPLPVHSLAALFTQIISTRMPLLLEPDGDVLKVAARTAVGDREIEFRLTSPPYLVRCEDSAVIFPATELLKHRDDGDHLGAILDNFQPIVWRDGGLEATALTAIEASGYLMLMRDAAMAVIAYYECFRQLIGRIER